MSPGRPGSRAAIGRGFLSSAVILFVLAALFWFRVLPLAPGARPTIAGLLAAVGLVDVVVGWWFVSRSE